MSEQFYTILTKVGKASIANATTLGTKVEFKYFALGDGNGSYYNPTEMQESLKNEVWRGQIAQITVDENNPNWIVLETTLPASIGGFMIREAGVFDADGQLLAVGKYPETYKPKIENGSAKDLHIRMILEVSNTSVVTLKIDPTVILATKKDIDILSNRITKNETDITELKEGSTVIEELETENKTLAGAINEINSRAGKIGTKEVDETDIKDNYTVRYDGKTDKVVWVRSEIDRIPPAPVTNIKVKEDNTKVIITYTTPSDDDYMGTRLVYKTGSYPTGINDGTVIGNYISGTEITGLTNDITYYFRLFSYDTSNNYNTDTSQQITAIPTEQKIYGVVIDESNSNPETSVTYTDDAVGFTPMRGNAGNFQWGSWQQIFKNMNIRPCLFKNGQVNYYINPNNYTKKLDGTSADITTGNDGDVMVEFPKLYWKMWKVGDKQYVQYSEEPFEGARCPAHTVGTVVKDRIYLPAYMGYTLDGKLRSLSGKTPTVSQTINTFRTQAQANGTGYQQFPYYGLLMLQVLGIVWFKSRDSQTALGRGYVDDNSASINTGGTNTKGMFYGETSGKLQNKFCGIEDFWGNVYYLIDGLYSDGNRNIMISNQDVFNNNGSGYKNYGQGATADVNGYIDTVQGGTETGFVIKTSSGSNTTHYCDSGILYGGCLPRFGGMWADGSNAGALQLRVADSTSIGGTTLAARLAYLG